MIKLNPNRKNKIDLTEYNYQLDIRNRLLLSTLTAIDLEILQELLNRSLNIPLIELADTFGITTKALLTSLDKIGSTGLFKVVDQTLVVNKELRKYFEAQIVKFDPDFKPDMEFIQALLRKPPIHVLPVWYSIPRTSDNIFQSLLERYLLTPRTFQRYLLELNFNDPIMTGIMEDVFRAPDFQVDAQALREKYAVTDHAEFEEYLLHLEFNFLCCLSYEKVDGRWKEIVTPFYEWRQYLRFLRDTKPQPLKELKTPTESSFPFIEEMSALLQAAKRKGSKLKSLTEASRVLMQVEWMTPEGQATAEGLEWLELPIEEQAAALSRHPAYCFAEGRFNPSLNTEQSFREIERNLERIARIGWVYLDDFIRGIIAEIGNATEVSLQKRKGSWDYLLPTYNDEEQAFIKAVLTERFPQLGILLLGEHKQKPTIALSPFGRFRLLGHY